MNDRKIAQLHRAAPARLTLDLRPARHAIVRPRFLDALSDSFWRDTEIALCWCGFGFVGGALFTVAAAWVWSWFL